MAERNSGGQRTVPPESDVSSVLPTATTSDTTTDSSVSVQNLTMHPTTVPTAAVTGRYRSSNTQSDDFNAKLFVSNIPASISELQFAELLKPFTKLVDMKFFKRVVSDDCYAFLHFANGIDGAECMSALNRRVIDGHTIRVNPASKRNPNLSDTNLYIEGIPKDWGDRDLRDFFSGFGNITAARVLFDKGTNNSREVGFVHFTHAHEAESAMATWNGRKAREDCSRPMVIKLANKSKTRDNHHRSGDGSHSGYGSHGGRRNHGHHQHHHGGGAGGGPGSGSSSHGSGRPSRYDEPCKYFEKGACKRGESCLYQHILPAARMAGGAHGVGFHAHHSHSGHLSGPSLGMTANHGSAGMAHTAYLHTGASLPPAAAMAARSLYHPYHPPSQIAGDARMAQSQGAYSVPYATDLTTAAAAAAVAGHSSYAPSSAVIGAGGAAGYPAARLYEVGFSSHPQIYGSFGLQTAGQAGFQAASATPTAAASESTSGVASSQRAPNQTAVVPVTSVSNAIGASSAPTQSSSTQSTSSVIPSSMSAVYKYLPTPAGPVPANEAAVKAAAAVAAAAAASSSASSAATTAAATTTGAVNTMVPGTLTGNNGGYYSAGAYGYQLPVQQAAALAAAAVQSGQMSTATNPSAAAAYYNYYSNAIAQRAVSAASSLLPGHTSAQPSQSSAPQRGAVNTPASSSSVTVYGPSRVSGRTSQQQSHYHPYQVT